MDFLAVAMRWAHIASMAFVVGGAFYARFVITPALSGLSDTERGKVAGRIAAALRPLMLAAVVVLLGSGTFNLLRKSNLPAGYHMWFGIKSLFALHVVAVSVLLGREGVDAEKRTRWLTGIAASGVVVMLISAVLRAMQQ
ncbi:MAG: hypothetical protein JNK48_01560 [Bryobacterales bacterium]|nr:hypothetical protein [Bryobacterales bacterium]